MARRAARPLPPALRFGKTIRQAYARAGLPDTGAHLLRHTMARRRLGQRQPKRWPTPRAIAPGTAPPLIPREAEDIAQVWQWAPPWPGGEA